MTLQREASVPNRTRGQAVQGEILNSNTTGSFLSHADHPLGTGPVSLLETQLSQEGRVG